MEMTENTVTIDQSDGYVSITVNGDDVPQRLIEFVQSDHAKDIDDPDYIHLEVQKYDTDEEVDMSIKHDDSGPLPDELRRHNDAGPRPSGLHSDNARSDDEDDGDWRAGPNNYQNHSAETRDYELLTDDDRAEKEILAGTSHHALLTIIDKSDDGVRPSEVYARAGKMPKGTMTSGLHELWKRKMCERIRTEPPGDSDDTHATYYVMNTRGEQFLAKHGRLTIDDWADQ
jgi:hypothetical protein